MQSAENDGAEPATRPNRFSQTALIELRGVTKSFGQVQALRGLDLAVNAGEILALVGDNGAGKTTAVKIIAGVHSADDGEIRIDGVPVLWRDPSDAQRRGIATVYQDLALVEPLDVVANLFLGREPGSWFMVDRRAMVKRARDVARTLEIGLPDFGSPVGLLSGGQRQSVAVGRAVLHGGRLLILDEPTAALGVVQTRQVLDLVIRLKAQKRTIILISHNLEQVFRVADRIHVMRLGRTAGVRNTSETTVDEVVSLITGGRDASEVAPQR